MINKIFVIGHPSPFGGADTELDHQIRVWQQMGLQVHIIHTGHMDDTLTGMKMADRGCVVHEPCQWRACKGEVVISYCNGKFLEHLAEIRKYARGVLWVNCMTWLFNDEKQAHKDGMIDYFIYQTDHARERVQDELIKLNPRFKWAKVKPYFHIDDFPWIDPNDRPADKFYFGRASRNDADKFHSQSFWVYETMTAPMMKEGLILGYSDQVKQKLGAPPGWIHAYSMGAIPMTEFYRRTKYFISMNDTYENLPRVAFEAMASGTLLIVDKRGGWKEQVIDGVTGWLCESDREFVYKSSRAAFEHGETNDMIYNAREWLSTNWSMRSAMEDWTKLFDRADNEL